MRANTVLVVGQIPDPHIERLADKIAVFGAEAVVFDCFRPDHYIDVRIASHGATGTVRIGDRRWDLAEFGAVWWRWKPVIAGHWTGAFAKAADEFASREWRATLRSLPQFLPNARWVNPLRKHYEAGRKPAQLVLARSLGLRVPATRITNDADSVRETFAPAGRVMYKPVSFLLFPPDEMVFANLVEEGDIAEHHAEIQRAPGTFQEYVEKSHEIRVTMVGDAVFAAQIDSQSHPDTKLDWRRNQLADLYSSVEIEPSLADKLRLYMRRAGLLFGAFDLIVTPSNEPVFLEVNPGGQWLWIEDRLNLPISDALARLLVLGEEGCDAE